MSVLDKADELQRDHEKQVITNVNKLAQEAWTLGIDITEIRLSNSFVQDIGQFGYGDKLILKAPKITYIETDYGRIKIVK
jgi:hypothetical protein